MFKNKCNAFLDDITAIRATAINEAVTKALATEHTPYVDELNSVRDKLIVEETEKTNKQIRALQEELEKKKNNCIAETEIAIRTHREKVMCDAEQKAKANYDTFILEVSRLVDSSNLA